jgi:3-oxo-5-alpha-steroid 4-dehydrogenase 1
MSELPAGLRPFEQVYLQPMGLFLLNLIAAMLPRAISGQRWYRKNFKEYPTKRKIVIPGLF